MIIDRGKYKEKNKKDRVFLKKTECFLLKNNYVLTQ